MSHPFIGEPSAERKAAFIAAKRAAPSLTIALLAAITERPTKQVEGFLYSRDRAPNWLDCYCVYRFLRRTNNSIAAELHRIIQRRQRRLEKLAAKHIRADKTPSISGPRHVSLGKCYCYRGAARSITEIATISGKSASLIYRRLRAAAPPPGADITTLIDTPGARNGRTANRYLLADELLTLAEIADRLGTSYAALYRQIRRANLQPGDPIPTPPAHS